MLDVFAATCHGRHDSGVAIGSVIANVLPRARANGGEEDAVVQTVSKFCMERHVIREGIAMGMRIAITPQEVR